MIRSIEGRRPIPSFVPSYDCLLPFSRECRFAQAGGRPLLIHPVTLSILFAFQLPRDIHELFDNNIA